MIKINRSGLLYILFSILLGIAATNTGNNLLYVISSIVLGFMGASGFFGKNNIEGIDLSILKPEEVYAGIPFSLRVRVRNRKRFMSSFLLRVNLGETYVTIPILQPGGEKELSVPFLCKKRGVYRIESVEVSSVFPLNLFRRSKTFFVQISFIVFPEPKRVKIPYDPFGDTGSHRIRNQDFINYEVSGLRDYNLRDPLRLIHWKASAKTGNLRSKKLDSGKERELFIDFENFPVQDVEERIKAITYMVIEATKRGIPVGIAINGKRIDPSFERSTKYRILRELALYGIN